ncbi:methyltransferase domain-containing protein [Nonomuraea jiangxiensis]|uniref:Methyltransferase domain-containing protein n=1 Tax=Nonomuraea jiangxiensis TaxID=633440 RepID=A0A1G8SBG4_9ACTN|nr:methyltransferase domain-containing protein [Nonomuraea jiangxiensis]SDJ26547.1 Methyltransferase domain-containing protein [Nonomuraea jiangxiensis]
MTRSAPAPHSSTYLLGSSTAEHRRLLAQGDLLREAARSLLSRLPLPDQARAIDVGCGPQGILDLLSDKVGPRGTVVGLDNDEQMITWARESIANLSLPNVSTTLGTLSGDSEPAFDLTHCRLLLINSADPEAIVASMAAATRPGGWIAVQEYDWATWQCDPPHPAWDTLKTLLASVFGGDVHIGARLPSLLRDVAGCPYVHTMAHTFYWRAVNPYQRLLLHFAGLFGERLHGRGLDPHTLATLTRELGDHLAHPATVVRESLLVQAWGRKP